MTPPRVIADRYEIEEQLGRGGMAEVYSARDRVLERSVAVKVLSERFSGDERFVTRFRREAQAAAGLNHRNIVSVFDTGAANGTPYIVMEKVDGPTLSDMLRKEGRLPPQRAAELASVVAEALGSAHREGLVHRDVKPGNIMLTGSGEVKVLDFGIARAAADDTLTQTGTVLGTASYLSPEQASGEKVDPRSDVYSLGCVLYEMLTGRAPFTADSPVQVAYQQVHEAPQPASAVEASVPPALEAVVMRALEKDPAARYDSGGEMRDAILAAVGGAEVATTPMAPPPSGGGTDVMPSQTAALPPPDEPRSRRPWVVAIVAVILAGLLAAGAFALLGDDRPSRDRRQRRGTAEETTTAPTVEQAFAAVQAAVGEGTALGEVEEETGAKILEKASEGVTAYSEGDLEGALSKVDDAASEVERGFEEGEITSEERLLAIQGALAALREAMEAAPPTSEPTPEETIEEETPVEEEEGGEEEEGDGGNGEHGKGKEKSKGKAKGHDK